MKIVSWNCNRGLKKKKNLINKLDFDIMFIQECQNLNEIEDIKNKKWIGTKNGLGIIWKDEINIKFLNWNNHYLNYFMPVMINDDILVIGVWAHGNYIEDVLVYLSIHFKKIKKYSKIVLIGDFNSNIIWDKKNKIRGHENLVNRLKDINVVSSYHKICNEEQGKELKPTFFMQRNKLKGYHIDYAFVKDNLIEDFQLGEEEWIEHSDHLPLILKLKEEADQKVKNK